MLRAEKRGSNELPRLLQGAYSRITPKLAIAMCSAVALYVLITSMLGILGVFVTVPYGDEWPEVERMRKYITGTRDLSILWSQHNEHRLVVERLLLLVDYLVFSATDRFLVAINIAIQTLHALVLASLTARAHLPGIHRIALAAFVVACMFSPVQLESLGWGPGVSYLGFAFGATISFVALAKCREPIAGGHLTSGVAWITAAVLAGTYSSLSLAAGLFVWPFLVFLAIWLRLPRWIAIVFVAMGVIIIASYLWDYRSPAQPAESLRHLPSGVGYVLLFLGNFLDRYRASAAVGGLGMLSAVAFGISAFLRRERPADEAVLLTIVIFAIAVAFITALGRMHLGPGGMMSYRYTTFTLLFWAALISLSFLHFGRGPARIGRLAVRITSALGIVVTTGLVIAQAEAISQQELQASHIRSAAAALIVGIGDQAARATLGEDMHRSVNIDFLRSRKLALFSYGWQDLIGRQVASSFPLVADCTGQIETVSPVAGDDQYGLSGIRVNGSLAFTNGFRPEAIALADPSGRISGFGFIDPPPPLALIRGWIVGRFVAKWGGYSRTIGGTISAYAVSRKGLRCTLSLGRQSSGHLSRPRGQQFPGKINPAIHAP